MFPNLLITSLIYNPINKSNQQTAKMLPYFKEMLFLTKI
ncbi:hypothetical protein ACIVBQ_002368 [Tenacibaculum discolor]